jgi:hypothetical protein
MEKNKSPSIPLFQRGKYYTFLWQREAGGILERFFKDLWKLRKEERE